MTTYNRQEIVEFQKNDGPHAGLSNMMSGYTLRINDVNILTSEALYQACKLPNHPEYQQDIIETKSPMAAKMKSRKYHRYIRADWKDVQVQVMEWCLRVKLAQNWNMFRNDLIDTGEQPIVEFSNRDDYWGAVPTDESTLQGQNVLGNLLMELRGRLKNSDSSLETVEPLSIPDFNLYACSITLVKPFPKQEQGRLEL